MSIKEGIIKFGDKVMPLLIESNQLHECHNTFQEERRVIIMRIGKNT